MCHMWYLCRKIEEKVSPLLNPSCLTLHTEETKSFFPLKIVCRNDSIKGNLINQEAQEKNLGIILEKNNKG